MDTDRYAVWTEMRNEYGVEWIMEYVGSKEECNAIAEEMRPVTCPRRQIHVEKLTIEDI